MDKIDPLGGVDSFKYLKRCCFLLVQIWIALTSELLATFRFAAVQVASFCFGFHDGVKESISLTYKTVFAINMLSCFAASLIYLL